MWHTLDSLYPQQQYAADTEIDEFCQVVKFC